MVGKFVSVLSVLLLTSRPVSYTHLDVYKRQHTHTHTHTNPKLSAETYLPTLSEGIKHNFDGRRAREYDMLNKCLPFESRTNL